MRQGSIQDSFEKHLVLVGGGHAHVFVLKAFAERPEAGLRITVVAKDRLTPYSGMLPGHVAGFYAREEMHIDLARLAAACGAVLIEEEAVGFDIGSKRVRLRTGLSLPYDVLSVDIGITPDLSTIPGALEHGLAVKPIGDFIAKWDRLKAEALQSGGPRRIVVVGGGAAGICLVFAAAASLRGAARAIGLDAKAFTFALVSAEAPPELNAGMRRATSRALERHGIRLFPHAAAARIGPDGVTLASGEIVPADGVLLSTQAKAPRSLAQASLAKEAGGFIAIRPTLQSVSDPDVFAAGDCATMLAHRRPKAGVFAVRQGPPLARNLRRHLRGEALEEHVPQKRHLVLISTGDGRGIGGRGRWLWAEGRFVWRLKDWIDRRFMRRFA
jgi:selenide,water dikinase